MPQEFYITPKWGVNASFFENGGLHFPFKFESTLSHYRVVSITKGASVPKLQTRPH
jgi:hypothetical protein